ncbi:MAG TPA: trypsin-like peptidase domain-containing protein [Acidimicrobiales bacterium]|nr:trypsin-like peptidase domain-containing protein [Acidimicrobiales bacterium]
MTVLDDVAAVVKDVSARVGPSVVSVGRAGCGVVIGPSLVATNAHNVRSEEVDVRFSDGRTATGHLAAADVDADLAVISVDTAEAPQVEWASDVPPVGTVVAALANPHGSGLRVTIGTVSSVDREFRGPRGRRIPGSVEHTAPLARGSSGGPLVDATGRVVALNTHRLGEGFYAGLPADESFVSRLSALARGEAPQRVRLGIAIAPTHVARRLRAAVGLEPREGLLVRGVESGGPADRAGIRKGDLIVSVGGSNVTSHDVLSEAVDAAGASGSVELGVVRGTEELSIVVGLGTETAGQEGTA